MKDTLKLKWKGLMNVLNETFNDVDLLDNDREGYLEWSIEDKIKTLIDWRSNPIIDRKDTLDLIEGIFLQAAHMGLRFTKLETATFKCITQNFGIRQVKDNVYAYYLTNNGDTVLYNINDILARYNIIMDFTEIKEVFQIRLYDYRNLNNLCDTEKGNNIENP